MTSQVGPSIQLPWTQRINFRLWTVLLVAALAVGYPLYQGLELALTGGISKSSDEKGAVLKVDLKSMSLFEMDPEKAEAADIPQKWRDLDGKRVELAGEMWLGNQAGGEATQFDLCYSIAKCCFSGPPKVQHFVRCSTGRGKSVSYYPNLVIAKGTLHVGIEHDKDTGKIQSVYRLDVESLRPG